MDWLRTTRAIMGMTEPVIARIIKHLGITVT